MRFSWLHSIRVRLFGLAVIAIAGLALVVVGVWRFRIEPALRQNVAKSQLEAALRGADLIGSFLDERMAELRTAAQVGQAWQGNPEQQRKSLNQLMKVEPSIRELSLVGTDGNELARVSRTRTYTDADLQSLSTRDKFRHPMRGESYIGPVYHEQNAEPLITMAVPIEASAVEIQGVLIAEINLKTLWNFVSHIKVGRNGYLYVVSDTGQLIAHPDFSKVVLGTNLAHLDEVKEFLLEPEQDPTMESVRPGYGSARVMTTYALVPKTHWGVIVEESIDTAFDDAHKLKLFAGFILALTVLAALAVSYIFSRRVAEPIRQLEKGSERIADGELDYRLDIRTGDEIEKLANKFNRMASALRNSYTGMEIKVAERTKEISSLYAAIAPLKPADSLATTLDGILLRLREATGADAARVLLWNKNQGVFVTPATNGFDAAGLGLSESVGQLPAVDQVFRQGQPIFIPDLENTPWIQGKKLISGGFGSCAFLPLIVAHETTGLLQLASRAEGFFGPEKENHLMAIARQMGIAIENRDLFEQTRRNLDRIHALHDIDVAIAQSLDLKTTLNVLLEKIQVFLPLSAAYTVNLFKPESATLEPAACRNLDEAGWKSGVQGRSRRNSQKVIDTKAPLLIRNVQTDLGSPEQPFFVKNRLVSYLGVPLMVKDGLLGVLALYTHEEHSFTAAEIDFFATLAGQAAIAINNSQLYEKTRKQTVELERSNRVKDEFLSVMSHELQTPLSVIMGYANLLKEEAFGRNTAEQANGIRIIRDRTDGLLAMVQNILEATQLECGALAVETQVVDVKNLLLDLKQTYGHLGADAPTILWNFDSTLPTVFADGGKLKKILHNLVDNAVKFTESGSITISARLVEQRKAYLVSRISSGQLADDPPGTNHEIRDTNNEIRDTRFEPRDTRFVEFSVADTGIGIEPVMMARLFEKFAQADSSDKRAYEGIGLGLFIVKKLTELLGGEVRVASEPGRGSTFTVVLPCRVAAGGQNKAAITDVIAGNGLSSVAVALERPSI